MKRKILIFAVCAGAIALAVAAAVGVNYLRDNKLEAFNGDVELFVYPGTSAEQVMKTLVEGGQLKWPRRMAKVFEKRQVAKYIKPGHYVIKKNNSAMFLARSLNNGWQTPVQLTLSGTMRRSGDIAKKISLQMMADSASVHAALTDPELLSKYGFTPSTVFAMLVPDTYEMWWTATPQEILERQYKVYSSFWTDANAEKAGKLGLSKLQVAIIASIVSAETNYEPEMPKVAGVYLNRLRKGMKLQADPTVAYCYDYRVNRILRYMLAFDSPYNTYRYAGLPPGPICVPVKSSLNAVLNPDYGDGNLFFCADPSFNGTHRFARNYSEHQRNARAFQKALNENLKAK